MLIIFAMFDNSKKYYKQKKKIDQHLIDNFAP